MAAPSAEQNALVSATSRSSSAFADRAFAVVPKTPWPCPRPARFPPVVGRLQCLVFYTQVWSPRRVKLWGECEAPACARGVVSRGVVSRAICRGDWLSPQVALLLRPARSAVFTRVRGWALPSVPATRLTVDVPVPRPDGCGFSLSTWLITTPLFCCPLCSCCHGDSGLALNFRRLCSGFPPRARSPLGFLGTGFG